MIEKCMNPLKMNCENDNIVVYIMVGSEKYPICSYCWNEIADANVEWDEDSIHPSAPVISNRKSKHSSKFRDISKKKQRCHRKLKPQLTHRHKKSNKRWI